MTIRLDKKFLKKQIRDLLKSNIPEDSKTGLHNLLGELLDGADEIPQNCDVCDLSFEEKRPISLCQECANRGKVPYNPNVVE